MSAKTKIAAALFFAAAVYFAWSAWQSYQIWYHVAHVIGDLSGAEPDLMFYRAKAVIAAVLAVIGAVILYFGRPDRDQE